MSNKFIIIDGNSLANRAFYAIPMLSNSQGFITNAIYGFYNMLARVIEEEEPAYLAVAFDKGKVVFRHQVYADYKGTRKGTPDELCLQFPVLKELLKIMRVAIYEIDGYEADDIIGTLVKLGEKEGLHNLIVTGDRDALQLVSAQTKVYLTRKGITELEVYDEQTLQEKYGLMAKQMIDVKGLMGDVSDNIPGIPGVGVKTAVKLIKKYGCLEKVLAQREDFRGKKLGELLTNYAEQAILSKKLATIITDVPLAIDLTQCQRAEPDFPRLIELLQELEFKNALKNVVEKSLKNERSKECTVGEKKVTALPFYIKLTEKKALSVYLAQIRGRLILYLETEKKGLSEKKITVLGIKTDNREPAVLCWQKDEELEELLSILKPYLEDGRVSKTLHDAKTAILTLHNYGINLQGVDRDTLLMAYLLNPSRSQCDLLSIAREKLNYSLVDEGEERVVSLLQALDELPDCLFKELDKQGMSNLYRDLELPLVAILAKMEEVGVRLDKTILEEMGAELEGWINCLTEDIHDLAGEKFNIKSPKQLAVILFEKLGLTKGKKTKTGYSTSADVLETLISEHEIVAKILDYRQMVKLKTTYIEGLCALINPVTCRVHTSFNQTITVTGRLSSTEPNLQNIPIRMEAGRRIRRAFLPSPGKALLSADYSQIELRVLAHMASDEMLIEAFNKGQDIHTRTAAEVFGVPMEEVTQAMRQAAKAVNFGIVYGISDFGLSRDLGISRAEAKEYIDSYFARYQGVKLYIDKVIAEAREKGYVTTLLNRRRYLPDIHSRNYHLRSFAERTAMNTPIQGSAADIIKLAMLKLDQAVKECAPDSTIILQVHDELILDVPEKKVAEVGRIVNKIMSEAYPLAVPLKVDVQVGPNWYDLKSL